MSDLAFIQYQLNGADAQKFLQGQVTLHVERLAEQTPRYTAICDLKGRIQFGLWLNKIDAEHFEIVVTQDQSDEFAKHIKKYGAFAKMTLTVVGEVFPTLTATSTHFSTQATDVAAWQQQAITQGQAYICQATAHEFQPQELRLHQREGVDYDKGCYLGQEIVARLWFKAKPKHWLHLVESTGAAPEIASRPHADVEIVNSIATATGFQALVVAKPAALVELNWTVLDLPEALNADVARPK